MDLVNIDDEYVEKPQKPMLPIKTLDKIFRRRYVPNTQYYFTNRTHAQGACKEDQDKPFKNPSSDKLLSFIKYNDRKTKLLSSRYRRAPIHMKYGQKFDKIKNLSKRLYVPEPVDDVKTIVGIHPEFNTIIEGRPVRCYDDIKVYIKNIRDYAMLRQQIGYKRDLVLRIEKDIKEESKKYDHIAYKVKCHVANFQKFLLEDHKKVSAKLAKLEKLNAELQNIDNEFLGIVSRITILNNIIFKLDSIRNNLKIYRKYCLFVAPIGWRQLYDESLQGRIQSIQFETGVFKFDESFMDSSDIDKTLEYAKIEFKNPLPPVLFFKHPQQMMYLFRTMELQSREYLIQLSHTGAPYRSLKKHIKHLKDATKQELDYFQYNIDHLIQATAREDYNANFLQEKFFRILNENFYTTVASPETLKLKICIEFVYEQVLCECEEGHQTLRDPMKILEELYDYYYLKLDALDFQVVKAAQRELYAQDLKYMKRAYGAQRELKACKIMVDSLNNAFLPPAKFKKHSTPSAIALLNKKTSVVAEDEEVKTVGLSEDDREGLLFFTDWLEGTDPEPYLHTYRDVIKPQLIEASLKISQSEKSSTLLFRTTK